MLFGSSGGGEVRSSQLAYWKQQLEGTTLCWNHQLTDRDLLLRPSGAQQSLAPSKELSEELTSLSQGRSHPVHDPPLAAFQTLLYRYTGQTDILVTPIANRNLAEIEGLIGLFVNT